MRTAMLVKAATLGVAVAPALARADIVHMPLNVEIPLITDGQFVFEPHDFDLPLGVPSFRLSTSASELWIYSYAYLEFASLDDGLTTTPALELEDVLHEGMEIGPSYAYGAYGATVIATFSPIPGTIDDFYMGLRFEVDGALHYAWLSVHVDPLSQIDMSVHILDFAWDTTPDTPIAAGAIPAPSALPLLVVGAAAVSRRSSRMGT